MKPLISRVKCVIIERMLSFTKLVSTRTPFARISRSHAAYESDVVLPEGSGCWEVGVSLARFPSVSRQSSSAGVRVTEDTIERFCRRDR